LPTNKGIKRLAIETEPHPIKYLTFEGVTPKNEYGGGQMWIFDTSEYEYIKKEDKKLKISLRKCKIKGIFNLIKTKDSQWLVDTAIEESKIDSIKSVSPMLVSLGDKIPNNASYFNEIKWDGIRVLIQKKGKDVKITSRNGNELTEKFPLIVESFSTQDPEEIMADGEIVALNTNGTPNFSKVVGRMHLTEKMRLQKHQRKHKLYFMPLTACILMVYRSCTCP
jgi:bifunctional non-homologous end joining protein LigD